MEEKQATLEDVPVMAPYVIRGGNKQGAKHSGMAKHSGNVAKRMSTGTIQDWKNRRNASRASWGNGVPVSNVVSNQPHAYSDPSSALPELDPVMDMDFDSIDFQNLDLGMAGMGMDDVNMSGNPMGPSTGVGMSGVPAMTTSALTAGLTADVGGMYVPATTQADFNVDMSTFDGQPLMSEKEMAELAGYSASFH